MTEPISILWETAEVTADDRNKSLTLTVKFNSAPDTFWTNSFGELRERQRGQDWFVDSSPSSWSETLRVNGVRPGAESDVRAALDAMVEKANELAILAERGWDEKKATEAREAEERKRAAEEMTERFRSREDT